MKSKEFLEAFDAENGTDFFEYKTVVRMLLNHPGSSKKEIAKWSYMAGVSSVVMLLADLGRQDIVELLVESFDKEETETKGEEIQ